PGIKSRGVAFIDTAEYSGWKGQIEKWLKLGLPHTHDEYEKYKHMHFCVFRVRGYGESGYDYDDQEQFDKDCDITIQVLNSAIENLEMDLVPETQAKPEPPKRTRGSSKYSGVNIAQAGTVVMGDSNTVSIVDS